MLYSRDNPFGRTLFGHDNVRWLSLVCRIHDHTLSSNEPLVFYLTPIFSSSKMGPVNRNILTVRAKNGKLIPFTWVYQICKWYNIITLSVLHPWTGDRIDHFVRSCPEPFSPNRNIKICVFSMPKSNWLVVMDWIDSIIKLHTLLIWLRSLAPRSSEARAIKFWAMSQTRIVWQSAIWWKEISPWYLVKDSHS